MTVRMSLPSADWNVFFWLNRKSKDLLSEDAENNCMIDNYIITRHCITSHDMTKHRFDNCNCADFKWHVRRGSYLFRIVHCRTMIWSSSSFLNCSFVVAPLRLHSQPPTRSNLSSFRTIQWLMVLPPLIGCMSFLHKVLSTTGFGNVLIWCSLPLVWSLRKPAMITVTIGSPMKFWATSTPSTDMYWW